MKELLITKNNQSEVIKAAVKVLNQGGVIVYPTETAYGLGADFFNSRAVREVYKIKGRAYNKPLPVIVSSLAMAKKIVSFNQISKQLAKKYWPGPLTLVLQGTRYKKPLGKLGAYRQETNKSPACLASASIAGRQIPNFKSQTIALRISSNKLTTTIVRKFGRPLTATSANLAGQPACYSAQEVISQFKNKKNQPDLIIDAGRLPRKKSSTMVKVIDDQIEVLRRGEILPIKSS